MAKSLNALELLRKDHRNVLTLLRKFDRSDDEREQRDLCGEIIAELGSHTDLEEKCFYPFVREATDRFDLIEEATIEHGTAKDLMHELERNPDPTRFHALVKVLGEYVTLHVREEEERIFPLVEKLGIDLEALGEELAERKGMPARAQSTRAASEPRTHVTSDEPRQDARRAESGQSTRGDGGSAKADGDFMQEHADELSRTPNREEG